jgi:hypothetical protein
MTHNWISDNFAVPININVSKIVRLGELPVSLSAGCGHWAVTTDNGLDGFSFRLQAIFVFPRKLPHSSGTQLKHCT